MKSEAQALAHFLDDVFSPARVAVIGASESPTKLGGRPVSMSLQAGFPGTLYAINPRTDVVQGLRSYPSVADLPEPIDCAVIAVPGPAVGGALRDAAAAGAKAVIVFAADYAETGNEGAARQEHLADLARALGLRMLGPNCMGAFNVRGKFYPTFLQAFDHFGNTGWPRPGNIAIVSQSGAIGAHLFVLIRDRGLGLSKFVTTGNQADIDVADCIDYLATDSDTDVIAVYAEGIRNGPRLLAALRKARANGKYVVVLKVGRSRAGAGAMLSHTASIAGEDAVAEALLSAGGAVRAASLTQLADLAIALAGGRLPLEKGVGVISLSGGGGVILADALEAAGFELPPMSRSARAEMRGIVPFCAPNNPVDPGAPAMTDIGVTLSFLRITFAEGGYGTVFLFLTHLGYVDAMMVPLREGLKVLRADYPERLLVLILLGPDALKAELREMGFLVFDDPLDAVGVVALMRRANRMPNAPSVPDMDMNVLPPTPDELSARQVLRSAGLPVVEEISVRAAGDATAAVTKVGGRAALKVVGDGLAHKSALGGVLLDISPEAAAAAFDRLMASPAAAAAGNPGLIVSPMLAPGLELFLGTRSDPGVGTIILCGAGGVDIELDGIPSARMAPIDIAEAEEMLEEIGYAERFRHRFGTSASTEVVAGIIARLSQLAAAFPDRIETIDVNPLIVDMHSNAIAVDALVVQAGAALTQRRE